MTDPVWWQTLMLHASLADLPFNLLKMTPLLPILKLSFKCDPQPLK